MSVSFQITGIPKLDRVLKHLEKAPARRVGRKAINAGLQVVNKAMRQAAPKGPSGNLRKSINKRSKRNRRTSVQEGVVGVVKRKAPHVHLVVIGTKPRRTRTGANRGRMPQNRFVEQVWQRKRSEAWRVLLSAARAGVVEEARRA